jgi:hypothetical protein
MPDWIVRMDVYPEYSKSNTPSDEIAVGGFHRTFNVQGEEILDAYHEAELIITGIKTNPKVWRCHITAIEKTRR